ncbi:MAG: hypothetical protein AAB134_05495 [Pseudomonadota bacterium]
MSSLDEAVELVSRWKADRQKNRVALLVQLDGLTKECQAAIKIWQGYVNAPGAPGNEWSIMSWTGPDRAKQLHDVSLRAGDLVGAICQAAGPKVGRFVDLDESIIETAYRQLKPGESGVDAAKLAISRMQDRVNHIGGLIERVRSGKPAGKESTKKKSGKKSVGKKAVKKKAAPKKK